MTALMELKAKYDALTEKRKLSGKEALEAVKRNGLNLRFVSHQTDEICLAAVEQNGWALPYVHDQTDEICLAAVEQNGWALEYVDAKLFEDKQERR